MAELGWLGLLTPPEHGGTGWNVVEACILAEETGRALSPINWSGGALAAAALASSASTSHLAHAIATGELQGLFVTGRLKDDAGTVRPSGNWVLGALDDAASAIVVASAENGLLGAFIDQPTRQVTPDPRAFDTTRPTQRIGLGAAAAQLLDAAQLPWFVGVALLLSCADTVGALGRAIDTVTDHLTNRDAFGAPLASLQVLQHRLVDLDLLFVSAQALVAQAAIASADCTPEATRLIDAAHVYVQGRVVAALDDCIQLAGGIGFTWEFPIHHCLRRALMNASAVRPGTASRKRLALAKVGNSAVTWNGSDLAEYRLHVQDVIAKYRPPNESREGHRSPRDEQEELELRAWYRRLYEHGLAGAGWPVEWGGDPGHHVLHEVVVTEELIRARAPRPLDQVQLASHLLLQFGTPTQKATYLPKIRSGQHVWCQLFSEPDVGSDLAGVQCRGRAVPNGGWVLKGQKTWTTDGHWADMGVALVRTTDGGPRHQALTMFLVPMNSPGIVVRPLITIGGAHEFNEVFLDDVHLEEESILGEPGSGWTVAMAGLETERFGVGGNVVLLDLLLEDLTTVAEHPSIDGESAIADNEVRTRLAEFRAEAAAAKAFVNDHVLRAIGGGHVEGDAAVAKLLYSETYNRIARFGVQLVNDHLLPDDSPASKAADRLYDAWLWSRALTISGGSSEIMRNILAKRRLQLPSAPSRRVAPAETSGNANAGKDHGEAKAGSALR
jgi:alkylation response protein AidB-like acyl-CoA dehydrogenase